MPRYVVDSDSEFSETDVSFDGPRRRVAYRKRSVSRRRPSPDSNTYLTPEVLVHRSASTGARRRRGEQPAVIVDINNDVRNRNKSRNRSTTRKVKNIFEDDSEEEALRLHHRPRASTNASRTPSPRARDWELMIDQRVLEKNDVRQDLELSRIQQEIDRLEREFAKRREHGEVRLPRQEEDWYEDEINERLRKLERLENKKRVEETRRMAEYREKVKRLEEMEREEAEKAGAKRRAREEHLKEIEKREAERAEMERIKKELRDEQARKLLEERERQEQMEKLRKEAIEEYKRKEDERIVKEMKEKEEKDKEFRERLKLEFGYSEEQIEAFLNKKEKGKKAIAYDNKNTFVKVHRKYLLPETLMAYSLPWEWDDRDSNYILIKSYISEELQEQLFAHTRRLREGKLIEQTSNTQVELKVNDRNKDKMFLVRKKSPRRSWIFT